MSSGDDLGQPACDLFDRKEVEGVLSGSFYAPATMTARRPKRLSADSRPKHYKVICISMYNDDLRRLDEQVREQQEQVAVRQYRRGVLRIE